MYIQCIVAKLKNNEYKKKSHAFGCLRLPNCEMQKKLHQIKTSHLSNVSQLEQTANSRWGTMQPITTGAYQPFSFPSCLLQISDAFHSHPTATTEATWKRAHRKHSKRLILLKKTAGPAPNTVPGAFLPYLAMAGGNGQDVGSSLPGSTAT